MRHKKFTFKIGRTRSHRKAMIGNMLSSLFEHGRIKTTVTKAKELRRWADKMITCAKKGDLHNRRKALSIISSRSFPLYDEDESVVVRSTKHGKDYEVYIDAVQKLFDTIVHDYKDRNGGYTRIIRLGARKGDAAELCYLELTGSLADQVKEKGNSTSDSSEENSTINAEVVAEEVVKDSVEEEQKA